ncbi:hypothetical protein HanPI659440_Chr11g0417921 [Helianthus annuus]|nr:hypothetical protein HanPI659440_Chr11g0417921 [Helianthus annuus]
MSPSTGGDLPPDPFSSPSSPVVSNLGPEVISHRISTRSAANKKCDAVEGRLGRSASGNPIPITKGVLKPAKSGKSRQPLANLNAYELNRDHWGFYGCAFAIGLMSDD